MKERALAVVMLCTFVTSCTNDTSLEFSSNPTAVMGPNAYRFGTTTDGSTWWWEVSFADAKDSPD